MLFQIFIAASVLISLLLLMMLNKKLNPAMTTIIMQFMTVALFVLVTIRTFWNDSFLMLLNGGNYGPIFYRRHELIRQFLGFGFVLSYIALSCTAFLNKHTIKNLLLYLCLPVLLVSLLYYNDLITHITTNFGRRILADELAKQIELGFNAMPTMILPLMFRFLQLQKFEVASKTEWLCLFGLLSLTLVAVVPITVPQSLFGFSNKFIKPFSIPLGLWLSLIGLSFVRKQISVTTPLAKTKQEEKLKSSNLLNLYATQNSQIPPIGYSTLALAA